MQFFRKEREKKKKNGTMEPNWTTNSDTCHTKRNITQRHF